MDAIPPTLPFHLARTYGVQPTARVRPVTPVAPAATVQRGEASADRVDPRVARLVAGVVPGGVDFAGDSPQPSAERLAFYRHPADRNAAATGVNLGRLLDTNG